jgi:hypothetical protein
MMSQKTYNSYYDEDGVKAMVATKLATLKLSNGEMKKSLEFSLNMPVDQLKNIYKNLSENQKKTKFGQAIQMIISIKEEFYL